MVQLQWDIKQSKSVQWTHYVACQEKTKRHWKRVRPNWHRHLLNQPTTSKSVTALSCCMLCKCLKCKINQVESMTCIFYCIWGYKIIYVHSRNLQIFRSESRVQAISIINDSDACWASIEVTNKSMAAKKRILNWILVTNLSPGNMRYFSNFCSLFMNNSHIASGRNIGECRIIARIWDFALIFISRPGLILLSSCKILYTFDLEFQFESSALFQ